MTPRESTSLADSIRSVGLLSPIVLYMGQVLDGWQRYRACLIAGVEPRFERYDGDNPLGLYVSLNVMRYQRTEEEREAMLEAAAEYRLREVMGDAAA